MAKYRPIYTIIWKDPDFEKYRPQQKLLFLYLCTNESTTESGIYPITIKTISNETGIPSATVSKLLANSLKNIAYDFANSFVFVKKFLKYNGGGRPDLLKKAIEKNYKLHRTILWNEFIKIYPEYSENLDTVNDSISNTNTNTNSISIDPLANGLETVANKEKKKRFMDHVFLSEEEHKRLIEKLGKKRTRDMIERLNNYIGQIGVAKASKKYKSHYYTILNWDRKDKPFGGKEQDEPPYKYV